MSSIIVNFSKKLVNNSSKNVSAFVDAWKRNWPLIGGTTALISAGILAGTATITSSIAIYNGDASTDQIVLFGVGVLIAVVATNTVNIGIRTSVMESELSHIGKQLIYAARTVDCLVETIALLQKQKQYEIVQDNAACWSRLIVDNANPLRIVLPTFRNECKVRTVNEYGEMIYDVCKERVQIWSDRLEKGRIEIVIPIGLLSVTNSESDTITFHRKKHDINYIARMAAFFDAIRATGENRLSNLRIYFSEFESTDRRSIFITRIKNVTGESRSAVIVYGNGMYLDSSFELRQVFIHYEKNQIGEANSIFQQFRDNSVRWSANQIIDQMKGFIPSADTEITKPIPSNFVFDHKSPFPNVHNENTDVFENASGDIFIRRNNIAHSQLDTLSDKINTS